MDSDENHLDIVPDSDMDVRGLLCPEPVMMLHNKVRDMADGDVVRVCATDPSTQRDIPKFCHFLGHELIAEDHSESEFVYLIKKVGGTT